MEKRIELLEKMLDNVCELMAAYQELKGSTEFAELISDYRYAALVAIQVETFNERRKLAKR